MFGRVENPLKHYFADLHSHTGYSDGSLLPRIAHDYARNVAGLDVFCLTDHLESVDDAEWLDARDEALRANEDGAFVVIPGLEWTKQWGHINIYDPNTRHWPADPARFYRAAADAGVTMHFSVNGAVMGDIVEAPTRRVNVLVAVDEADDKDAIAKIELFEDGEIVATVEPKADSGRLEATRSPDPGAHFYFAKVTQTDGDLMWSAPVWVTVGK